MNLRMPLPADFSPEVETFVKQRCTVWDASWPQSEKDNIALVQLRPAECASFLEVLAVTTLIVLEPSDDLPCRLSSISVSEALAVLISRVWRKGLSTGDLVRNLGSIATAVPAFRLEYSSSEEAAAAVRSNFGH